MVMRHQPNHGRKMINGLFYAHSGLRYLILLVGLALAVNCALALRSQRASNSTDRILTGAFTGLLDLQLLLGIALVVSGILYPALVGHIAMMVLAVVVAHATSVMARRASEPRRAHALRLAGALGALVLILGGISAIGRAIFGTGAPSM
jgi:heme A synthase